ncbi:hypothetical protein [Basilea psittacipulmonis]|uniref:Uncharacterized protein n=1 Tax=Basilea psittacipulmonis DSM 24701 TaxID=1072685 RepID=A0A077DGG9_9BURK|nr:hypothetical protein [Basilea psittacipulmonis]AIL32572.1 hypothetical protein IX83_03935 [Basilea psittacipulmonis DSM 24701]
MSVLDLPIERQREIAKICGYDSLEKWQADKRAELEENERLRAEMEAYKPTKAEIRIRIDALRKHPNAICYYQRISGDFDLTAEEVIRNLENTETID